MVFYMRCQNSSKPLTPLASTLLEINSLHERPNSRQCKAYTKTSIRIFLALPPPPLI